MPDEELPKLSDLIGLFKDEPVDVAGDWPAANYRIDPLQVHRVSRYIADVLVKAPKRHPDEAARIQELFEVATQDNSIRDALAISRALWIAEQLFLMFQGKHHTDTNDAD